MADTVAGSKPLISPERIAVTRNARPPVIIWSPVETRAGRGSTARLAAKSEPSDQKIGEMMRASRPAGSSEPTSPAGNARIGDADQPDRDPHRRERWDAVAEQDAPEHRQPHRDERDEEGGDAGRDGLLAPRDETHAAQEEHAPTIVTSRSWATDGRRIEPWSRRATPPASSSPAGTKRRTPITNGGIVSIASFMPRYVEPHTT